MKTFVPHIIIVGLSAFVLSTTSMADIFAFKDTEGFASCLKQDHLVETTNTSSGKQSKWLNKTDVQHKCFLTAEKKLKSEKSAKIIKSWIDTAFKNSANENAIHLIGYLVKADKSSCNEDFAYDTVLKLMDGPSSKDSKSLYQGAVGVVKTCLKDKTFKTDFMDEQNASKTGYRYKNVCEILKNQKLIKKCYGS